MRSDRCSATRQHHFAAVGVDNLAPVVARPVARRPPTYSPVPVGLASAAVNIRIERCLQLYVDNRPAAIWWHGRRGSRCRGPSRSGGSSPGLGTGRQPTRHVRRGLGQSRTNADGRNSRRGAEATMKVGGAFPGQRFGDGNCAWSRRAAQLLPCWRLVVADVGVVRVGATTRCHRVGVTRLELEPLQHRRVVGHPGLGVLHRRLGARAAPRPLLAGSVGANSLCGAPVVHVVRCRRLSTS